MANWYINKANFMLTRQELAQAEQAELNRIVVPKPNIEVSKK